MGDTVVTLRPDGDAAQVTWTTQGGAPSAHSALSDDSDSTYLQTTTVAGSTLRLNFGTFALPALAIIHRLAIRVRVKTTSGTTYIRVNVGKVNAGLTDRLLQSINLTSVLQTISTSGITDYLVTQTDIDNLTVGLSASSIAPAATVQVMELYADVYYNQAPTATLTAPIGTVANTTRPTVAWLYSDAEGDVQERYRIKVYNGGAVADPETVTAGLLWDSGSVFSAMPTAVIGADLGNGTNTVYVKVADAGSAGRFGPWVGQAFTVAVDPPAIPTIAAAVPDPASAQIAVTVFGHDNLLTAEQSSLEGGTTTGWAPDANCAVTNTYAFALDGARSLGLTASGPSNMGARTLTGTSGVPVVGGTSYTALASYRPDSTTRAVRTRLDFYSAGGVYIATFRAVDVSEIIGWTQSAVTAVAPSSAAFATVVVEVVAAAGGEVHYVDQISVAPGSSSVWTRGGFTPTQTVNLERSVDGGTTWTALNRPGVTQLFSPQEFIYSDFEAPPNLLISYRARMTATDGGFILTGSYSPTMTTTLTATAARLKDLQNPALNQIVCLVNPPLVSTSSEPQQAFTGLGDPYWSVSSDVAKGEVGDLTFAFDDDAAFAAFEALRRPPRTLLLQTGYGDNRSEQFYVRLGADRTVTRLPAKADNLQARIVTVGYRQVQEPA